MDDGRQALSRSLAQDRAELEAALGRLRVAVGQRLPVHARIRAQPLRWVGVAFVMGFIVGARRAARRG